MILSGLPEKRGKYHEAPVETSDVHRAVPVPALFYLLAEAVDINLHVMTDYTDADAWTVRSGQVVGANLYLLVSNLYGGSNDGQVRLERWSAGMNEPETVLEGLRSYRNESTDATTPVVTRLLADGGNASMARRKQPSGDAAGGRRGSAAFSRCARWRPRRKSRPKTASITAAMSALCSRRTAKWCAWLRTMVREKPAIS